MEKLLKYLLKWRTPFYFYIFLMAASTILIFSPYYFNISPSLFGTLLAETTANSVLLKISHGI
jgi:hypothetical protein